jgi:hypothetical protein
MEAVDTVAFVDSELDKDTQVEQEITTTDVDGEKITLSKEQLDMYMKMLRKRNSKKNTKKSQPTPKNKKSKRKSVKNARRKNRG